MPSIVKLTTAGESVTMKVMSCVKNTVGNYPGVLFSGNAGTRGIITVEVPESSTKRQLDRLELTPASIVGRTVTISRDPNPGNASKPYWGISFADVVEGMAHSGEENEETGAPPREVAKAPTTTHPVSAPVVGTPVGAEHYITGYLALVDRVAAHIQKQTGADFKDYATAQPIAATIFITLQKQGLA